MEFGDKGFPQFIGPGKGKTEHRSESLETGSARLRDGQVDLPSPSLPTRFALNPQAIPTPQPNIQVKDGMLIAELSVLDLVVKAEDPAAHPEKIWEAPTVSLGIQSFTGTFHPEWSQDLNPHDCACLSDFFRILSDRALAKLPGEAPSREVEEPKIHQREHDGRFVILDQKGTPFWWASFDNEAEARLAWSLSAPAPKLEDASSAVERLFDAAAASTSFELDIVLRRAAVAARLEMARALENVSDVAYWEKRVIQESDDVKTVVDDVLDRADRFDFNPVSSGNTADLVRDSAALNSIELTPLQVDVAVEMIQDQFPTAG